MTDPNDMSFNPRTWLDADEDDDGFAILDGPGPSPPTPRTRSHLLVAAAAATLILVTGGVAAFATRDASPATATELASASG